jgi:hypothetical protein
MLGSSYGTKNYENMREIDQATATNM